VAPRFLESLYTAEIVVVNAFRKKEGNHESKSCLAGCALISQTEFSDCLQPYDTSNSYNLSLEVTELNCDIMAMAVLIFLGSTT
jgi:hypothetical protein